MALSQPPPARDEQLRDEATVSPSERAALRRGAELFGRHHYWDAHEVWEKLWQDEPRPIRSFYQGLIQIAAGYHHWTVTHRPQGVQILLAAGINKLRAYAPRLLNVDIDALTVDTDRLRSLAEDHDAGWLADFPAQDLPPIRWTR